MVKVKVKVRVMVRVKDRVMVRVRVRVMVMVMVKVRVRVRVMVRVKVKVMVRVMKEYVFYSPDLDLLIVSAFDTTRDQNFYYLNKWGFAYEKSFFYFIGEL